MSDSTAPMILVASELEEADDPQRVLARPCGYGGEAALLVAPGIELSFDLDSSKSRPA